MKRVAKAVLPKAARPGTSNGTSSPNQEHPKERHQKKNQKNQDTQNIRRRLQNGHRLKVGLSLSHQGVSFQTNWF